MGPESSDPTSHNTGFEFVPLPADSPFLSDHGLSTEESPPPRQAAQPPSNISQFPPSVRAVPQSSVPGSTLPERPRVPPPGPGAAGGGFTILQDSISSFPLYMGDQDPYGARRTGSSTAAIPVGAPVPGAPPSETDIMARIRGVLITATDSVQGRLVEEYLGPVNAEVVVPASQLLEGSEPQGKLLRHKAAQHRLRQYHQLALAELRLEADKIQGNAILASSVQMHEMQGVLIISAFGTAVRLV